MHGHQTGEDLARANGFPSFRALMAASRHLPTHGPEQFLATSPTGHRFLWGEDDIAGLASHGGRNRRAPRGRAAW